MKGIHFVPQRLTLFHVGALADYWIGPKGAERKFANYDDALEVLSKMSAPSWRGPNPAAELGNCERSRRELH